MNIYNIITLIGVLSLYQPVWSQVGHFNASAAGRGNTVSIDTTVIGIPDNPASLGFLRQSSIAIGFGNTFNIIGLNRAAITIAQPFKFFKLAATLARFGDDSFKQTITGVAVANKLGLASLGVAVKMLQTEIVGFGSRRQLILDFAGIAKITPGLQFSAGIENLSQAKTSPYLEERLPTVMRAGLSLSPSEVVMLVLETQKDFEQPAVAKLGISYEIINKLIISTGIIPQPASITFGLNFNLAWFTIHYAGQSVSTLGSSHQLSISKTFR